MAAVVLKKHRRSNPRVEEVPDAIAMSEIVEVLPDESERVREAILNKKALTVHGVKWVERRIVLLKDKLAMCRIDSDRISEHIPLAEVTSVHVFGIALPGSVDESPRPVHKINSLRSLVKEEFGRLKPATEEESHSDWGEKRIEKLKPKFEIATVEGGFNGGRRYCLQCRTERERDEWILAIQKASVEVKRTARDRDPYSWHKFQQTLRWIHDSIPFEYFFALVILATFANSIALSEMQPEEGSATRNTLELLDTIFTIAFAVELAINMGAGWFREFWFGEDWAWNWFDFVIVTISFVVIFVDSEDSRYGVLRLIRILRVVKILREFKALNKIVSALSSSVIPVANAFIILGVVSCIYAIIGVDLFQDVNPETFGRFSSALFTMFQVLTGDSWASAVARPLFIGEPGPTPTVALFFVTFIVINGIFVLNVVIAVLLDEFIGAVDREKKKEKDQEQQEILETTMHRGTAIDPLLHVLASFTSMDDLTDKIHDIFKVLDVNETGVLTQEELSQGLSKLNVSPQIRFSEEDFEVLTEGRKLCNDEGEVTPFAFDCIIKAQLKEFMKRHVGARMAAVCRDDIHTETILFMLKTLMFSEDAASALNRTGPRAIENAPLAGLSWGNSGAVGASVEYGDEDGDDLDGGVPRAGDGARGGGRDRRPWTEVQRLEKKVEAMGFNVERRLVAMNAKLERVDEVDAKLDLIMGALGVGARPLNTTQGLRGRVPDKDRQTGIGLWKKGKGKVFPGSGAGAGGHGSSEESEGTDAGAVRPAPPVVLGPGSGPARRLRGGLGSAAGEGGRKQQRRVGKDGLKPGAPTPRGGSSTDDEI